MTETLHNLAAGLHDRLLDGELDENGRRWLAEHRARCRACNSRFASLERIAEALRGLEALEPRPGFVDRVLADVRPAPVPVWARWQLSRPWQKVTAITLLVVAGVGAIAAPTLARILIGEVARPATLFRGPEMVAELLLAVLRWLAPLRPVTDVVPVLGRTLLAAAGTPEVVAGALAGVLLAGVALLELSHVLAPRRRQSSYA